MNKHQKIKKISIAFLCGFTIAGSALFTQRKSTKKCNNIVSYAKKHGTKVIFIAAATGQDGGSEKYIFLKTKQKKAYFFAQRCFSQLRDISYKKFKRNKFIFNQFPNEGNGIFTRIKLKRKGQNTIITYSSGI